MTGCNHMNLPPISREGGETNDHSKTSTAPSKETAPIPSAASQLARNSPRRRQPGERGTPRSSRLGKEVFSASDDGEHEGDVVDKDTDLMDVDEET